MNREAWLLMGTLLGGVIGLLTYAEMGPVSRLWKFYPVWRAIGGMFVGLVVDLLVRRFGR